jgi:hypothetical protein
MLLNKSINILGSYIDMNEPIPIVNVFLHYSCRSFKINDHTAISVFVFCLFAFYFLHIPYFSSHVHINTYSSVVKKTIHIDSSNRKPKRKKRTQRKSFSQHYRRFTYAYRTHAMLETRIDWCSRRRLLIDRTMMAHR